MKTALICGISGQDGALLGRYLVTLGYRVVGTSRDAQMVSMANLRRAGIEDSVILELMTLTDFRSIIQILSKYDLDEIYNFSGQSSVGLSFQQPVETIESIAVATVNLLEAIRIMGRRIRIYNAGSGECFGETGTGAASENSPFCPRSPYGVAKSASHWVIRNYRETYGLWACNGILFNHELPLRPERFVTKKIVSAACRIAEGKNETLRLGNLKIRRDWGWAPEYVEVMWRMLQLEKPEDFVIATGVSHSLEEFVQQAFRQVGLDWRDHVTSNSSLARPLDIFSNRGCADKAERTLGWRAQFKMQDVVRMMVEGRSVSEGAAGHSRVRSGSSA